MNGYSLHIGLNELDPAHYGGWDGKLNACEFDASKMETIARSTGYTVSSLLSAKATRQSVIHSIQSASQKLKKEDIFLLTYSGHGGQVPDQNGEESDGLDETWCLYDGQLIDDELYNLWSDFNSGVRILILSDSCHSGTVIRGFRQNVLEGGAVESKNSRDTPQNILLKTYLDNKPFYDGIMSKIPHKSKAAIQSSIRLISGCQDNQLSYETPFGGDFTNAVVEVWNGGRFDGNYEKFHKKVLERLPAHQSPNHMVLGVRDSTYDNSVPFSI